MMNMKMEPIKIDLKDNGAYTQVAFLIDREGFQDDIEEVRNKFKITVPFSENPFDFENHLISLAGFTPDQVFSKEKKVEAKIKKVEHTFREAIAEIRRKYQYPEIFDDVIKQAILFHQVTRFKTAYATFFNQYASREIFSPSDTIMAIAVTPFSTEEDIKSAFQDCKENIREFVEMFSPVYKNMEKDTITNIKRDRTWYWGQKSGMKYKEILDKWNRICPNFVNATTHPDYQKCQYCDLTDQNVIEKAVSRYKKNLNPLKS